MGLAPQAVSVYPTPSDKARMSSGVRSGPHPSAPPVRAPNFQAGKSLQELPIIYSPHTFAAATSLDLEGIEHPGSDGSEEENGE